MAQNRKLTLSAILRLVDDVTRPARRVARALHAHIIRPLAKATRAVAAFGVSALKMGAAAAGVAGGFLALVGREVLQYADAADRMAKTSRQVGLTVEELSRLAYAADLSGVSFEELIAGLRPFSKNLEAARLGTGELFSLLSKASPTLLEALRSTQSVEEAFALMAGAAQAAQDPMRRNALLMAAFGESGVKFASLFAGGADGLKTMTTEADRLGFTLSTESATAAEQFNDDINRLKRSLALITRAMSEALIPALTPLIQQATEWAQANKQILGQRIADWTMALVRALKSIDWAEIARMVERLARKFAAFLDELGGAEGIIRGVGTALSWIATAFEATGYVLGTAAAVIAEAITSQWRRISDWWGRMTRTLGAVWQGFTSGLSAAWEGTISGLIAFGQAFGAMWSAMTDGMRAAWESVTDFFIRAWQAVVDFVQPLLDAINAGIDATVSGLRAIGVLDEAPATATAPVSGAAAFAQRFGFDVPSLPSVGVEPSKVELEVSFKDAPAGMRVARPAANGPVTSKISVRQAPTGRRTLTEGAPL